MNRLRSFIKKVSPPTVVKVYKQAQRIIYGPQKSILITGWLGAFNLGDEMMLHVTLYQFRKIHPNYKITLLVHKYDAEVADRYSDYHVVVRRGITDKQIAELVSSNDAFFVNGGALLDSVNYGDNIGSKEHREMTLGFDIARIAKAFNNAGKDTVFYGLSSNDEIKNKRFVEDYRQVILGAKYFSVRDQFSKEVLSKIADRQNIPIVDDIEFADPTIVQRQPRGQRNHIGIIPILYDSTIDTFEYLTNMILDETELNVKLILFYDEGDNDMRMAHELRSRLGGRKYRVNVVTLPRDSKELYSELNSAKVVFSMRYHGTLFAGAVGKPVICIDWDRHPHYKNKNQYLAKQYGFVAGSIEFSKIKEMRPDQIRKLLSSNGGPASISTQRSASRQLHSIIKQV